MLYSATAVWILKLTEHHDKIQGIVRFHDQLGPFLHVTHFLVPKIRKHQLSNCLWELCSMVSSSTPISSKIWLWASNKITLYFKVVNLPTVAFTLWWRPSVLGDYFFFIWNKYGVAYLFGISIHWLFIVGNFFSIKILLNVNIFWSFEGENANYSTKRIKFSGGCLS